MKKKIITVLLTCAMLFIPAAISQAASGWYELNGTMITVHVPLPGNASWEVNPVGVAGLELITSETNNGEWVATYAYNGEYVGNDRLEVICMVDGVSYGHYTVDMWYAENGEIEVTNAFGDVEAYSSDTGNTSETKDPTDFAQPGFTAYTAYVTAENGLALRNGPGREYDIVGSLEAGQKISVVGMTNGWAMTYDENGRTGYCSSDFLSASETAAQDQTEQKATEKKTTQEKSIAAVPKADYTADNTFMQEAINEAREGIYAGDGGPFGSVIVKDGVIVGRGHNRVLSGNDPTCHGEVSAIRDACTNLSNYDLTGYELYTTGEPCPMCLCACLWANIDKVYYGCTIDDNAEIGFRDSRFDELMGGRANLKDYLSGIDRDACLLLFKEYNELEGHTIY